MPEFRAFAWRPDHSPVSWFALACICDARRSTGSARLFLPCTQFTLQYNPKSARNQGNRVKERMLNRVGQFFTRRAMRPGRAVERF